MRQDQGIIFYSAFALQARGQKGVEICKALANESNRRSSSNELISLFGRSIRF